GQVVGGNNDFLVVNPTTTTSYTVTISDGCSPDTSYTVTATVAEPVTLTVSSDSTICEGDDVTLTATGAGGFNDYTYTWSTPGASPQTGSSITVSPTATTTYTVEMTEATCQQTPLSETVVVEVINTPTASFSLNPNPLCEGAPIDVEFTGNIPNTGTPAFDWDFGVANVQSGSGQGPYVISYDDAGEYNIDLAVEMTQNGVTCPAVSTTEQMVVEPQPVADFDVPSPQCLAGNAYEFVATGSRDADIDFTWSFQDAQPGTASSVDVSNVKFQSAGVKSVTLDLSAAGGLCTDEITKPVTVWPNPDAPDMQGDSICPGYEATLFVVQPVAGEQYIWNGGAGANDYIGTQLVTPRLDRTQNYTVYSRDANGCESLTRTPVQAYVHPQAELNISYSPEQPETPNAIVSFRPLASIPIVAWNWQFGDRAGSTDEQPVHQYQKPGTKSVAVSAVDENGCISSEIIELEVEETPAGGLPTGFSPNGDGLNDVYEADLSHMTEVSFRVYSRMGQLVFESSTPTFEWDGTGPNGSTLPEGTYPYILEYTLYNGVSDTRTGTITILR
ncbi:MAG: PKD domain-containing protein, partial [Bacteroidota bacterium]